MKKTLIALTVAASAAVSGSAMAWTVNGTGGSVDLGGTLTPTEVTSPWEVQVGSAVNDLNANVLAGETQIDLHVNKAIPVLGIRTTSPSVFNGKVGLTPQISYGDSNSTVDLNSFSAGVTSLSMKIFNASSNEELGQLVVPFTAVAESSWNNALKNTKGRKSLFADTEGRAFFGGLAKNVEGSVKGPQVWDIATALNSDVGEHYLDQGAALATNAATDSFSSENITYSGYYSSGIQAGSVAKITLNSPASGGSINWKANLPVVVSYL